MFSALCRKVGALDISNIIIIRQQQGRYSTVAYLLIKGGEKKKITVVLSSKLVVVRVDGLQLKKLDHIVYVASKNNWKNHNNEDFVGV